MELEVVHALNNMGYNVATSRSQSKAKDNDKIDIFDLDKILPTNIQVKYCKSTPNYFNIRNDCSDKTLPFSIIWKKSVTGKSSPGTVAIIPVEFFYQLLKEHINYIKNGKDKSNI